MTHTTPPTPYHLSVIITAAGSGSRFSSIQKKQFVELNGKPIISYAIELFTQIEQVNEIIVTMPPEHSSIHIPQTKTIKGGLTRQDSVFNALKACNPQSDLVIIHDAVRPFLAKDDLVNMINLMSTCDALIPASRVKNTIKSIYGDKICQTILRENLIEVYTPQIFKLAIIRELHTRARELDVSFTDDASICEHFGFPVHWYETTSPRLKITTPDDLAYAEYLLSSTKGAAL